MCLRNSVGHATIRTFSLPEAGSLCSKSSRRFFSRVRHPQASGETRGKQRSFARCCYLVGYIFFNYLEFYSDHKLREGENHQLCDSGPSSGCETKWIEPVKSEFWDVRPIVGRLSAGPAILDIQEALSLLSPCARPAFVGEAFTALRFLDYPPQEAPESCEGLIISCCLQNAFSIHQIWVHSIPSWEWVMCSLLFQILKMSRQSYQQTFAEPLFCVLTHLVLTAVLRGGRCHFQVGDGGSSGNEATRAESLS